MIASESLRMASASLWTHKVRSLLTILGVTIGIGAVLAVVSLGASFEESIVGQFDSVDQKTIFVTSTVTPVNQGPPDCQQFCKIFTQRDLEALEAIPGVERVIVTTQVASTSIRWQDSDLTFESLTATVPEADEVRASADYRSGGAFALGEAQVVLGHRVAMLLSPEGHLEAGATVSIRFPDSTTTEAVVSGILAEDTTLFGDRNGRIFVPVDPFYDVQRPSPTTGEEMRVYEGFTVVAASVRDVDEVQDRVHAYIDGESDALRLRVEDQEFLVATASDIQSGISAAFDQVTLFIAAIAVISLVVGAVGIANIMLVAVAERTREIGVMKALGAKDGEVLTLFLLEAFLIGLVGALVGIAIGIGTGAALVSGVFADQGVSFVMPWGWLGLSIAVGVGTGAMAGFLPALRATKIQPVVALSRE